MTDLVELVQRLGHPRVLVVGDVMLDRSVIDALRGRIEIGELRHDESGRACAPQSDQPRRAGPAQLDGDTH